MKILVLGGTRFIGAATVSRLHELGHQIAVFNRGRSPVAPPEGTVQIEGDRDKLEESRDDFAAFSPDVVLHNIVVTGDHASQAVQIFKGMAKRLVMVSSCDVYRAYGRLIGTEPGPPDPVPLDEDAPLREKRYPYRDQAPGPEHLYYHYDKIPAEETVMNDPDLPGTVLRLPMVIGPNDYQHRLFPYLKPMEDKRPALVFEDGYAGWRSTYDYVDNVAECIALACTDERAAGRVYNVGAWHSSILELAELVQENIGWDGQILQLPKDQLSDPLKADIAVDQPLVGSCERIRSELGYVERVDLREGIRRTLEWERVNPPDPVPPGVLNYEAEDEVLKTFGIGG